MPSLTVLVWIGFLLLIGAIVAQGLRIFHRHRHLVTLPEALGWSTVLITGALAFSVGVYLPCELNPAGWRCYRVLRVSDDYPDADPRQ